MAAEGELRQSFARLAIDDIQGGGKMEANEASELQEHAEHGAHESAMRPVAFTMSLLAVLVAVTTVLGHRTHTEAVLDQNKATDQWN